jgi:hypothetical protein
MRLSDLWGAVAALDVTPHIARTTSGRCSAIVARTRVSGMQVAVDRDDVGNPKRLRLDGRSVEIIENIDRWPGSGYCYFKVRGDDDSLYILRLDATRDLWELTMFRSSRADTLAHRQTAQRQL